MKILGTIFTAAVAAVFVAAVTSAQIPGVPATVDTLGAAQAPVLCPDELWGWQDGYGPYGPTNLHTRKITLQNIADAYSGTSVSDTATGGCAMEMLIPVQTTTGASHTFVLADMFKKVRRSNSGSAMTDTFPALGAQGMVNGARINLANADVSASDTVTAGTSTQFPGAASTYVIPAGRDVWFDFDLATGTWRPDANTGSAAITTIPNVFTALNTFPTSNLAIVGSSTGYTAFASLNAGASNYTATLPANTGTISELNAAQTYTSVQSYDDGDLSLNGSSSGASVLHAPASGGGAITLPSGTKTLMASDFSNPASAPSNGQIPIGNGSTYTPANITAGAGVMITNGSHSITIAAVNGSTTYPTYQVFTSGTGTYTTPVNVTYDIVTACGAGGGGGGLNSGGAAGGTGGTTSFGSTTAVGGTGGSGSSTQVINTGGAGGTGGVTSTGIEINRVIGQTGETGDLGSVETGSGSGGSSAFLGGGAPRAYVLGGSANGIAAVPNTGGGGSGATSSSLGTGAGGGGAGECIKFQINAPSATYSETVGAGGLAGAGAQTGGAGAAGKIVVEEHYNY